VYSELTAEIADAIAHLGWLNKLPDHIVFCNGIIGRVRELNDDNPKEQVQHPLQ
jgi:hypothetical protein